MLLFLLPGLLSAANWAISATFTDGGTVTGTFALNNNGTVTNWNVVVSGNSGNLPRFVFSPGTSTAAYNTDGESDCTGPCLQFISNEQISDNGSPATYHNLQLDLSFLGPLSGTDTVNLYVRDSSDEPSNECLDCSNFLTYREFTQGSATPGAPITTGAQPANTTAYVLNDDGSLVTVTGGTPTSTVSTTCEDCALDIARDAVGNLIVADGNLLNGYTPGGAVLPGFPITTRDEGNYTSVAIDASGNYIVADTNNRQILLIPPPVGGVAQTPQVAATYSGGNNNAKVRVDSSGNYILAVGSGFNQAGPGGISLYWITPGGVVTPIPITPTGTSNAPTSVGGLTFDANGNYVVIDPEADTIFTISPYSADNAGASTPLFSDPNGYLALPVGLYRDPLSGLFFLGDNENNALYTLTPDGSVLTQIASGPLFSSGPSAVVVADTVASTPTVYQPLSVSTTFLPSGTAGVSYGSVPLTATGGSGNYSWAIFGAPAGLSVSANGVLSGTPTAAGTFSVIVSVGDATAGMSAQQTYTISIAFAPLTLGGPASLGGFAPSANIAAAYTATGGKAPYTWSATGLPVGLAINASTGSLSGSIALPGNYTFTVQLTDTEPVSTNLDVSVSVLGIATTSLPDGTNKISYSQSLTAVGGNPPYAWSLTAGALPPGLALANSGVLTGTPVLSGTPAAAQTFPFTVSVTAGGVTVSKTLSLDVTLTPEPLSIPGAGDNAIVLPSGPVQVGYSQALEAAGGVPAYSWSVFAGALPDGLSLSSGGTISGTPTRVGSFAFTGHATDSSGGAVSAGFAIAITPLVLTITVGSPLPNGIVGTSYPVQILTATGGIGPYTFQANGSLPGGLTLSGGLIGGTPTTAGAASFTVTVTDSSQPALSANSEIQILIQPAHTDLVLSQSSVSFLFNAGATSLPPGVDVAGISVGSNSPQPLGYSVNVTPAAPWLDVTSGGGTTPGVIGVSLDPKALALGAGSLQTSIVVTCVTSSSASQPSPCAGNSQTIDVTLRVIAAPPLLSVAPSALSFSAQIASPAPASQSLILQNAGGGTIAVNSVTSPDAFVSLTGVPATIPASGSAFAGVTVNPLGLSAGFYQSTILVNTSAGSANVPVTFLVSQNATLTLNPAGTQFPMLAGSSPGNPNGSFSVDVSSASAVSWTASVLPGASWLQLNTASGSSTSGRPGAVTFSINPAVASTLAAQAYYGTIQVTSGGLASRNFLVVLNVAALASSLQPNPAPAGLVFISNGTSVLPPQTVQVFSSSLAVTDFSASTDSPWLSVTVGGTTVTSSPGFSSVSVNASGLAAGVYRGAVSYEFTDPGVSTAVRAVNVTLIVEGPSGLKGAAAAAADVTSARPMQSSAGCAPAQLVPTQTGLVGAFAQPASWPTPLTVLLVDDCSNPVPNGQIVATFSNGDPPLQLSPVDATSGNYTGTWTPRNSSAQITIAARATAAGFAAATTQITGQVTPKATPILTPDGTLNAFSTVLGGGIAPGTIVQIYGSNLASQTAAAAAIPLPNTINRTQVLIGGLPAPLYYVSPGQINAQVPFELNAGQQYEVIVNANGALSTPNPIQLASAAPAVLGFATGQIIATHLDGSLVLETSPAAPGEVIVFYVAGMGLTNQTVVSGTASPSTNLASPLDAPTMTLNGVSVTNILFDGLTPTLVGLYQVDFQVPAATPNGDQQLVLTQANGQSNTTVLPVHN